ncbi:hypothetical protein PanWU01x14_066510, partial [Parasponia andersonii]
TGSFPAKLFAVFLLLGLYLATSALLSEVSVIVDEGDKKSLSHVFSHVDQLRLILARKENKPGCDNLERVVPSRSLRLRFLLIPPPPPTRNRQTAMRSAAPPPLVA